MAPRNPWLSLWMDAFQLGLEAQTVIGLRMMRAAMGGTAADKEAQLMVTEKIAAGLELQRQFVAAAFGPGGAKAPSMALSHMRRKVRANRRRLLRGG